MLHSHSHPGRRSRRRLFRPLVVAAIVMTAVFAGTQTATAAPAKITAGDPYVALGSSFAANGPADVYDVPCGRSSYNYAHLAARALRLKLTDVTCGGATTANLLDTPQTLYPSGQVQAPQIDAVGPDTKLVTITAGGNDVNYIVSLYLASCAVDPTPIAGTGLEAYCGPPNKAANQAALDGVADKLTAVISAVRQKAPQARILVVDYLGILPQSGRSCDVMPLPAADITYFLDMAHQLAAATKTATERGGAQLVELSRVSRNHDACATVPWVTGWEFSASPGATSAYHPNALGQAAAAALVVAQVKLPRK